MLIAILLDYLIVKDCKVKDCKPSKISSFECIECLFTSQSTSLRTALIYRVPPSHQNKIPRGSLIKEFSSYLDTLAISYRKLLILGDLNVPWDTVNDRERLELAGILTSFNLKQHVTFLTHIRGHILDWVITRDGDKLVSSITNCDMLSDHTTIIADICLRKLVSVLESVRGRNLKALDIPSLCSDLTTIKFNTALSSCLDPYAPEREKVKVVPPVVPWFNQTVSVSKREKRAADRQWRTTGLEVHKQIFLQKQDEHSRLLIAQKQLFYKDHIEQCNGDQKKLFSVVNGLLHQKQPPSLPSTIPNLAQSFFHFLVDKINLICAKIDAQSLASSPSVTEHVIDFSLNQFSPASEDKIRKIILHAKDSSCARDRLPTPVLKDCVDTLLPVITWLMNLSLSSGVVPDCLKHAVV